jgi:preprotein translocase subunit SecE
LIQERSRQSLCDTEEGEVAESRRRGEDAVDEDLDDVLDDAVEDDAPGDAEDNGGRRGGATRTLSRAGREWTDEKAVRTEEGGPGPFGRLGRFVREVVAELRKVIWPTRKELLTYTAVVIVFVTLMLTIVGLLDLGFAKGVLFVFGGGKK